MKLFKLWNNRGECLLKWATKEECRSAIISEMERHPFDSFELEFQCTQEELDRNRAAELKELKMAEGL